MAFVPSVFVTPAASALRNLDDALEAAQPANRCRSRPAATARRSIWPARCWRARPARRQQVPYKGCGPALTDVTAGQVPLGIVTASSAAPLIAAGKLRALAVTSPKRSPLLPQVATVAEQGVKDYALDQWHGLLAPAATPPAVIDRINVAVARIMQRPDVQVALREQGFTPATSTPAAFQSMIRADIDRYAALTEAIGLRAD